jgi:hypothetical protein
MTIAVIRNIVTQGPNLPVATRSNARRVLCTYNRGASKENSAGEYPTPPGSTHSLGKVIQHALPPSHINQTTPLQLFQYPPNNLNTCLCPMASSQASCSTPPLANIAAASPSPSPSAGANSRQILCGSSCLSRSGAYGALRSERWNFLPGREAV